MVYGNVMIQIVENLWFKSQDSRDYPRAKQNTKTNPGTAAGRRNRTSLTSIFVPGRKNTYILLSEWVYSS